MNGLTRRLSGAALAAALIVLLALAATASAALIKGGPADERLTGTSKYDRILAGKGDDVVFARDRRADFVNCGPGADVAVLDRADNTRGCERRIYPPRPAFTAPVSVLPVEPVAITTPGPPGSVTTPIPAKPAPAPVPAPAPAPEPSPEEPEPSAPCTTTDGGVQRFDGSLRSAWGAYHGPRGTEASRIQTVYVDLPGDPRIKSAMRITRLQGDFSQYINEGGRNGRLQLQGPRVFPINAERWQSFYVKFEQVAAGPRDWHLIVQAHSSGRQVAAPLNLAVDGATSTMIRHTPTGFNHRYVGFRPLDLGVWHHYAIGWRLSTSPTGGWIRYYRDGELVADVAAVRTSEDGTGNYPVIGFYLPARVGGIDRMLIAGYRVTDERPVLSCVSDPRLALAG